MIQDKIFKLSHVFYQLSKKSKNGKTSVKELVKELDTNSPLLLIVLFALPLAFPLPHPPLLTTLIGIPLIILSIHLLFGINKVRLPKKIENYQIRNAIIVKVSCKAVSVFELIERYIKPRLKITYFKHFIGLLSLICSIIIALPCPFTTAIPALGVVLMALGLLNNDGLVMLAGMAVSILGLVTAYLIIMFGLIGIKYFLN